MTAPRALGAFTAALCEGLVAGGVRHVCLCPGSRSTPLVLAVARSPALQHWMHLDERSCSYFALGLAKATREPVAIICTSGTAALNFAPALAEASRAGVPLVALTADRPPELRAVGANQTVDQGDLFGRHAKRFIELPTPDASQPDLPRSARHWGLRAASEARTAPAGPVHLNLPFREPLIPEFPEDAGAAPGAAGARAPAAPAPDEIERWLPLWHRGRRGLIVCGPQTDPAFAAAASRLAGALGYPLLADPLSQLRRGGHDRALVIDAYDALLRAARPTLRPELVLRLGGTPTSRSLARFLREAAPAEQLVVAGPGGWNDPDLQATAWSQADPTAFCEAALTALPSPLAPHAGWVADWRGHDDAAGRALNTAVAGSGLSEPRAVAELLAALPSGATLYAGNSLAVRDVDSVLRSGERPLTLLANRGASGIDGVVSSALGAAAGGEGPLALVLGDLSLYHDMNGLLAASRFDLDATIIVLNNDGGGIFSLLPQAEQVADFEALFGTPHGMDFRHAAAQYGLDYARPDTVEVYREALRDSLRRPGVQLIEVRSDRAANASLHRDAWARVEATLAEGAREP